MVCWLCYVDDKLLIFSLIHWRCLTNYLWCLARLLSFNGNPRRVQIVPTVWIETSAVSKTLKNETYLLINPPSLIRFEYPIVVTTSQPSPRKWRRTNFTSFSSRSSPRRAIREYSRRSLERRRCRRTRGSTSTDAPSSTRAPSWPTTLL